MTLLDAAAPRSEAGMVKDAEVPEGQSVRNDAAATNDGNDADVRPLDEIPFKAVVGTLAGVMAAMFMAALDGTIIGTAMPRVIAELDGVEHYAAATTVYMIASTVVLPIVGKLSDQFGRKPFLLVGVAIFMTGSALCGAAESMTQLVLFRGLQGLGAGFSQAMAFTTIADLFPPAQRGRITGFMGAIFGLSSVAGPAIGGFLTDGPGWRWCFYVNVPVGAVAFMILLLSYPKRSASSEARPRIDWAGATALVLALIPVLVALSSGGRDFAWGSPEILAMLGAGLVFTAAFLVIERRAAEPILPLSMFRHSVVWTSSLAATLISVSMFGASMFIPLFIQGVVGASATKSGAVMTPMMLAMIFSSVVSGQLMSRRQRYKANALVGAIVTTAGLVLLAGMGSTTSYAAALRNMIVLGLGLGATMPVFTLAIQNVVAAKELGVATSSVQFLRSLGGSVGGAVFGAVLAHRLGSPPMGGSMTSLGSLGSSSIASGPAREALAAALQPIFSSAAILAFIAVVTTLFLKDVPLKGRAPRAP